MKYLGILFILVSCKPKCGVECLSPVGLQIRSAQALAESDDSTAPEKLTLVSEPPVDSEPVEDSEPYEPEVIETELGELREIEEADGDEFRLQCLIGDSKKNGKVTLKLKSGFGGLVTLRKLGSVNDEVYIRAGIVYHLISDRGEGDYEASLDGEVDVVPCEPDLE